MNSQITTRTKRRLEKKYALWMMGLVLLVSLASFFLGIMMGKRVSPSPVSGPGGLPADRIPVAKEKVVVAPPAESAPTKEVQETKLTFYDALPRSQAQPLGTGINPPPPEHAKSADKPVSPPSSTMPPKVASSAVEIPAAAVPAPASATVVAPVPRGELAVQVASFRKKGDAEGLIQRLGRKGFPGFVMEVDLQGKGIWYRAMVGPFGDREAASTVAQRLKTEEKMAVLIKQM